MTTNKTPIQELIEFCVKNTFNSTLEDGTKMLTLDYDELKETFDSLVKKEKAFAFDCFEAGKLYGIDLCLSIEDVVETREPKFDEFYSKYAKQHAD